MEYKLISSPSLTTGECLVLGVFADTELSGFSQTLDKDHQGLISRLKDKVTDAGDSILQADLQGASLLLIQCGKQQEFNPTQLQKRINDLSNILLKQKFTSATICLPQVHERTADWQVEQMLLQIDNVQYQLLEFKKKKLKAHKLESVCIYLPGASEQAVQQAKAIAEGITFTRNLANMPANICTPSYLGEQAMALAKQFDSVSCTVLDREDMQKMGMGTLLAVAQGSDEPPRLIDIHYKGSNDAKPIVLVGKGITFDSGGLSIKPANAMDEMKYDMCGAASVLGTIKACALLKLPVNVIGIIPSTENLISGKAVKPGDIATSMSGQTVEIINTDAEGRLILADALTYAERYQPQFVLDLATLTGAIIVALGTVRTGYMTKDDDLAAMLEQAGNEIGDKVWRMPLDDAYQEALESPLADMINANFDRNAGAITAACFLSRFTEKFRWAHLDIAGTSWIFGKNRNATGRPVPLLIQLIRHVSNTR